MTANQARVGHASGDPVSAGLPLSATERTRHRRLRALGRTDRESLYAVLRAGLVAHLGVIIDGWPMVIPTVYGFDADTLYLHGSVASQSLGTAGIPVCVTVTLACPAGPAGPATKNRELQGAVESKDGTRVAYSRSGDDGPGRIRQECGCGSAGRA
jgi:Pyridoxamine 5'-phosphate oxidase